MRSINTHSVKHIPERTCLACRQKKAKQDLIRLVRTSDGRVEVDNLKWENSALNVYNVYKKGIEIAESVY